MKKLILAAAASTAMLAAAPAFAAGTDSSEFDINASVAKTCVMQDIEDIELNTVDINTNAGALALLIEGSNTGNTGNFYVSCNDTNSMSIVSTNGGQLKTTTTLNGADAGQFKNTINYSLGAIGYRNGGQLNQPGFRRTLFGLVAVNNGASRGAVHRQVSFGALIDPLNNLDARPVAGNYTDTITVTVTTS
jgi:spore coat protein U-like protein